MNLLDALVIATAYENQSRLSSSQRELYNEARRIIWEHAEKYRSENP